MPKPVGCGRVKPKCPKCGKRLDSYATYHRRFEAYPFGVACKCGWSRVVSRKDLVRIALAGSLERVRERAYSDGYSAGHEDQMRMRVLDEMERRRRTE